MMLQWGFLHKKIHLRSKSRCVKSILCNITRADDDIELFWRTIISALHPRLGMHDTHVSSVNSFATKKADDKIFACKLSKNVKSKLYHIENSKTRGQTV